MHYACMYVCIHVSSFVRPILRKVRFSEHILCACVSRGAIKQVQKTTITYHRDASASNIVLLTYLMHAQSVLGSYFFKLIFAKAALLV